jgi:hypothetical protein
MRRTARGFLWCVAACAGVDQVARAQPATPAPAADPAPLERVDYTAKIVELIESRQRENTGGPNGWDAVAAGVALLDAEIVAFYKESESLRGYAASEETGGPTRELQIAVLGSVVSQDDPAAWGRKLGEEFLGRVERAGFSDQMDKLVSAHRVLAPMPTGHSLFRPMPEPGQLRQLTYVCAARGAAACRAGDQEAMASSVERLMAVGRAGMRQVFFIDFEVGLAAENRAARLVRSAALKGGLGLPVCERLSLALAPRPDDVPVTLAVDLFRLETLDGIDQFFEKTCADSTAGMAAEEASRVSRGIRNNGILGAVASQPRQNAKAEEFFKPVRELAGMAFWKCRESSVRIPGEFDDLPQEYAALSMLIPDVESLLARVDASQAQVAGARLMVGLEQYRAAHSTYPEKLTDLVPEIFRELPADPFFADGFRYRRLDAASDTEHRSYILYSVGRDGQDNGGKECPQGQQNVIGRSTVGRGFDFVINSPRD